MLVILRVVLDDQLSRSLQALDGLDGKNDVVLMAEVMGRCTDAPHRAQLIY